MKLEYYFANLDLTVVLSSEKLMFLDSLTNNESLVLQQQIYLAISGFLNVRALYTLDAVEFTKRMDGARAKDEEYRGEH